jgi:hypothetical protein
MYGTPKKIVTKLSKIRVRDPGSGIWNPESLIRDMEKNYSESQVPDPGVNKAPDPGSRSTTLGENAFKME